MAHKDNKDRLEFTWRNLIRVARELDTPEAWRFLFDWARSKQGGRNKQLGRKGDNDWCFKTMPAKALPYDPQKKTPQEVVHEAFTQVPS
jgi:hypothetical protein